MSRARRTRSRTQGSHDLWAVLLLLAVAAEITFAATNVSFTSSSNAVAGAFTQPTAKPTAIVSSGCSRCDGYALCAENRNQRAYFDYCTTQTRAAGYPVDSNGVARRESVDCSETGMSCVAGACV